MSPDRLVGFIYTLNDNFREKVLTGIHFYHFKAVLNTFFDMPGIVLIWEISPFFWTLLEIKIAVLKILAYFCLVVFTESFISKKCIEHSCHTVDNFLMAKDCPVVHSYSCEEKLLWNCLFLFSTDKSLAQPLYLPNSV